MVNNAYILIQIVNYFLMTKVTMFDWWQLNVVMLHDDCNNGHHTGLMNVADLKKEQSRS